MARGRIVLAPSITGIPELIIPGKTGFLYQPGEMDDFVDRILFIHSLIRATTSVDQGHLPHVRSAARLLDWVRHGAHAQVRCNFNRQKNLKIVADLSPCGGSNRKKKAFLMRILFCNKYNFRLAGLKSTCSS